MADFKSSFMGGYKKKDVDEYIQKLEKENENLKGTAKANQQKITKALKLQDEYKKLKSKVNELENQKLNDETEKTLLAGEIKNLSEQLDALKAQLTKSNKVNDNHIANIGKIFYSAYESGSEIATEAKTKSADFLSEIAKSSINAKAEIENAIAEYSLINTDIKALVDSIVKSANLVSDNTDKLIEKAKGIANSMSAIDDIRLENENNANDVIKKYDAFFKEYESEKTSEVQNETAEEKVEVSPVLDEVKVQEVAQPEVEEIKAEKIEEVKEPEKEVAPPSVQPIIANEVKVEEPTQRKSERPQRPQIQRQAVSQNRPPVQRRPIAPQRQSVAVNQKAQGSSNDKQPHQNSMNENRATMLREVLKKFQNPDEHE